MIRTRLKQTLKTGLKKILRVDLSGPPPRYADVGVEHLSSTAAPPLPRVSAPVAVAPAPVDPVELTAGPVVEEPLFAEPVVEAVPVEVAAAESTVAESTVAESTVAESTVAESTVAESTVDDADDTAGLAIAFDAVQEILDDMVRPALQGDGGDITLLKIEEDSIYVRLVGSCSSCPSSIMTMKLGVEALLREEFPMMKDLIQVD